MAGVVEVETLSRFQSLEYLASTRITTLSSLPSFVTWGVMIIPALAHRAILHSNIRFSSLIPMHLGSSILGTSRRRVPVSILIGTFPHIVTRFNIEVTVAKY